MKAEIELATRDRYAGEGSPYTEWVTKVQEISGRVDRHVHEARLFLDEFPRNSKAITVPMDDFVQGAKVAEETAHAFADELEEVLVDVKTVLKAKKARK